MGILREKQQRSNEMTSISKFYADGSQHDLVNGGEQLTLSQLAGQHWMGGRGAADQIRGMLWPILLVLLH